VFPTVREAIAKANRQQSGAFRVCEFSVQEDHIHLLVEATTPLALARGMRGLALRIALALNRLLFRRGPVFADRWHGRPLTSPREVRNALVYVLANFRKHREASSGEAGEWDVFSSAPYFRGFREFGGEAPCARMDDAVPRALAPPDRSPVLPASTWLLREGWRRYGLISLDEEPRQERGPRGLR